MRTCGFRITIRSIRFFSSRTLPGQWILRQHAVRLRRQLLGLAPVGGGELAQEVIGQQRNVLAPLAQRRHVERNHVQPVEQILAKIAALDLLLQILVGGRDHAHVHLHELGRAHRLEALLVERAQHLGLRPQAHVADLVQEQRAAVGLLELADLVLVRAGEAALAVAEQLALDQLLGNGRAVDLDERLAPRAGSWRGGRAPPVPCRCRSRRRSARGRWCRPSAPAAGAAPSSARSRR